VIQEANVGVQLVDGLWLDGGYFLTHVGNELLTPKDNLVSSHALVTTYEPFYQAGFKIGYTFSDKFEAQLHLLNGYGIVTDNNDDKSLGAYLAYKPTENTSITYAGVYGNERPRGTPSALRLFHNLNLSGTFGALTVRGQVDFATEERLRNGGTATGSYLAGQVTAKYAIGQFAVSARGEFFDDAENMLAGYAPGLVGAGGTLGLEFKPLDNAYIRAEGRLLNFNRDKNLIFRTEAGGATNARTEFAIGFGVWL
jgi:Putative beta-barrel porin-2, OmpL-like. bbp2